MTSTTTAHKPNKVRLRRIARLIEKHPEHFDMNAVVSRNDRFLYFDTVAGIVRWFRKRNKRLETDCGTTACIAGWAVYLYPDDVKRGDDWITAGSRILGLDKNLACNLFLDLDLTPKQAAKALNGLADSKPATIRKYADA